MKKEIKKLIRKSIRERLRGVATEYTIRKVIKANLENPHSWWNPDDDGSDSAENIHEAAIKRYYSNINNTAAINLFLDFQESLMRDFKIFPYVKVSK